MTRSRHRREHSTSKNSEVLEALENTISSTEELKCQNLWNFVYCVFSWFLSSIIYMLIVINADRLNLSLPVKSIFQYQLYDLLPFHKNSSNTPNLVPEGNNKHSLQNSAADSDHLKPVVGGKDLNVINTANQNSCLVSESTRRLSKISEIFSSPVTTSVDVSDVFIAADNTGSSSRPIFNVNPIESQVCSYFWPLLKFISSPKFIFSVFTWYNIIQLILTASCYCHHLSTARIQNKLKELKKNNIQKERMNPFRIEEQIQTVNYEFDKISNMIERVKDLNISAAICQILQLWHFATIWFLLIPLALVGYEIYSQYIWKFTYQLNKNFYKITNNVSISIKNKLHCIRRGASKNA